MGLLKKKETFVIDNNSKTFQHIKEFILNGFNISGELVKTRRGYEILKLDVHKSNVFKISKEVLNILFSDIFIYRRNFVFVMENKDKEMFNLFKRIVCNTRKPGKYSGRGIYTRDDKYKVKKTKKSKKK